MVRNRAVVDRLGQAVGALRRAQLGIELHVDFETPGQLPFGGRGAVAALEGDAPINSVVTAVLPRGKLSLSLPLSALELRIRANRLSGAAGCQRRRAERPQSWHKVAKQFI